MFIICMTKHNQSEQPRFHSHSINLASAYLVLGDTNMKCTETLYLLNVLLHHFRYLSFTT